MPFYAVAKGRNSGIYSEWSDCKEQVTGYSGAVHKKFDTAEEANRFVQSRGSGGTAYNNTNDYYNTNDFAYPSSTSREDGLAIYTDGACSSNGRQGAKAGIGAYAGKNHPLNFSEPLEGRATNNNAEIQAARMAIERGKEAGHTNITIKTDSEFLKNCNEKWMPTWKENGWRKVDGTAVVNKDELMKLDKACKGANVKFEHVPSHKGIVGNEQADRLAREGAKKYESGYY